MNIKVLVLDTQVYSNTGGQSSTASYMGQNTKFSVHGTKIPGKIERHKELAQICMMHPNTFVAQTSCAVAADVSRLKLHGLQMERTHVRCYTPKTAWKAGRTRVSLRA